MAFNKVFVVLLLLIVAAIANARVDFLEVSDVSQPAGALKWRDCCNNCVCEGPESCKCIDFQEGECPESCAQCLCRPIYPIQCVCVDKINTCPTKCPTSSTTTSSTQAKLFESLLALKSQIEI